MRDRSPREEAADNIRGELRARGCRGSKADAIPEDEGFGRRERAGLFKENYRPWGRLNNTEQVIKGRVFGDLFGRTDT
jgi:hypothetical protein